MNESIKAGFTYVVDVLDAAGNLVESSTDHNLMPDEGIAHVINAILKQGSTVNTWYVGLFEGNYTPTGGETAATFPVAATECSAYAESTRVPYAPGTPASGTVSNGTTKAEFTMSSDKIVYGGFISSAAAKGSTSGTLISVVRFSSPKSLSAGSVLRVTAGFALASI